MSHAESRLELRRVGKTYRGILRRTVALRDVTLSVRPGEIVGLVGANGAGKTTLMMIALGFLYRSSGRASVLGRPPGDVAARRRIGWIPDEPILPPRTSARELLEDWLASHGFDRARRADRIDRELGRLGLAAAADRPTSTYSLGMQQKVSIALALCHDPELLVLDEPFSALDHRTVWTLRDRLDAFRREGGSALVSSHHLPELEAVCDRAVFMKSGAVEREEPLLGPDGSVRAVARVEVASPEAAREILRRAAPDAMDGWSVEGAVLTARLLRRDAIPTLVERLAAGGAGVRSVVDHGSRLESVFMEIEEGER